MEKRIMGPKPEKTTFCSKRSALGGSGAGGEGGAGGVGALAFGLGTGTVWRTCRENYAIFGSGLEVSWMELD